MRITRTFLASLALGCAASANASGLGSLDQLSQSEFEQLAHDAGSALSYKSLTPGDPLGITGFDVGVEASATSLGASDALKKASGKDYSTLVLPRVHATKGLPLDLNVGASYAYVPGVGGTLYGLELGWSPIAGGVAEPAVSLRATYSHLVGVNELDFHSTGLEAMVSKGFTVFKPYVGAGLVHSVSTPHAGSLESVSLWQTKYFGGVNFNAGIFNLALEMDHTGDDTSYGMKLGFRF